MSDYPSDLKYTNEHEWAKRDGDLIRIGITLHAVEQLGDVTLVDLPEVGTQVETNGHFGDIESVKAVSELFSPLAGEIVEVNERLAEAPELVNDAPYGEGWMVAIRPSDSSQFDGLMDAEAYQEFLASRP
ncbi:MAG: glycine cleavage system protein GcvH [Myxococcales bacterium]|nr:glycine cleavage system protein GcvH [Myxococcales bacterium]MDD9964596.1 glycine cleavage system protein GcvH [Myxococcales bacterium]